MERKPPLSRTGWTEAELAQDRSLGSLRSLRSAAAMASFGVIGPTGEIARVAGAGTAARNPVAWDVRQEGEAAGEGWGQQLHLPLAELESRHSRRSFPRFHGWTANLDSTIHASTLSPSVPRFCPGHGIARLEPCRVPFIHIDPSHLPYPTRPSVLVPTPPSTSALHEAAAMMASAAQPAVELDILGPDPLISSSRPCLGPRHPLACFWTTHVSLEVDQAGCRGHFGTLPRLLPSWVPRATTGLVLSARRLFKVVCLGWSLHCPPATAATLHRAKTGKHGPNLFRHGSQSRGA